MAKHIHIHIDGPGAALHNDFQSLLKKLEIMSDQLNRLEQEVAQNGTVIGSAIALIRGFGAEITAIKEQLAAEGVTNAKLNELADTLDTNEQALAAAVAENTPAAATEASVDTTATSATTGGTDTEAAATADEEADL